MSKHDEKSVIIYTDGASRGNPGPGGWGAVLIVPRSDMRKVFELGGHEDTTTNNRMELAGLDGALDKAADFDLETGNAPIVVHTDSAYTINAITKWIYGWQKNGWKTTAGEPVANREILESIFEKLVRLKLRHEITFTKVSGHSGVVLNERADDIATGFADSSHPLLFTGSFTDYEKLLSQMKPKPKTAASKKSSSAKAYSYVSLVGGAIHVDKSWPDCEKRVKGVAGARFQKSLSPEDEQELIGRFTLESL